ncbi:hypothetical protein FI667_g3750, partial [Globisporangium splendens]
MVLDRLSACVEEMRNGGSSVDQQTHQRKLLKELFAVRCKWDPELLAKRKRTNSRDMHSGKHMAGGDGPMFSLLLQALLVYSGNHTGNPNVGASGASGPMSMSLTSSSTTTSECVQNLICDLLVRAFDYSAIPVINETLTAKNTSIYVKASLVLVVSHLPLSDAIPFLPEVVAFANKQIKTADYYMKQCLIESVTRILDNDLPRLVLFHTEALKIVSKTFQDKTPEVRLAAAGLLHVLALHTTPGSGGGNSGSTSGGSSNFGNSGNGSSSGSGNGSGAGNSSSSGSSGNANSTGSGGSVTQESIMYIATRGMDDSAPDARRAYSVVVGIVLAKFATGSPETDLQQSAEAGVSSGHNDDENRSRPATEHDNGSSSSGTSSGGAKSKLAFKMPIVHLSGMSHLNLPGSLSRRKAAAVHFSTVASIIGYLKETIVSRYLTSTNPNQHHGGILASYSIALCSLFEQLPPDTITEPQFSEILDAILSILDHPFALGDLTRARNAVGYVLRFGIYPCLTERQQEALLGAYLRKLKDEVATAGEGHHHKLLSILVEISHMLQAMGEACVSHAQDASTTLQTLLSHEKQSVRFQASVALASLVTALPYKLKSVLTSCIKGLRETSEYLLQSGLASGDLPNDAAGDEQQLGMDSGYSSQSKAQLYIVQGRSSAIAHILRATKLQNDGGLAHSVLSEILQLADDLVASQYLEGCADSVWLTCTRAGWTLVGSLVAVNDEHWVNSNLQSLLTMWLKASVLQTRESSLELLRIEAAVVALNGLLSYCKDLTKSESVQMLAAYILNVFLSATTQDRLSNPLKRRGQVARYRVITSLIKSFVLLPPIFSDSYIVLLDLIAEYTVAQSLTSLRQSPLVPASSTFLHNALSGVDDPLEMVSASRLAPGDTPSVLYSRELNHILALIQPDNALSDTELEVQYLDNFWSVVCEMEGVDDVYARGTCSSFTYVRLVDASVFLFGRLFHFVPEELQLRCLQHYAGVLADGRVDCEVNVASLLFAAIREAKHAHVPPPAANSNWPHQIQTMLCEMLSSENAKVRRGAGEALGMLALLLSEANCKNLVHDIEKRLGVAEKSPLSSSSLSPFGGGQDASDMSVLSAGAAFALACIKRVCGSRISIDTGIIFRFAGEISQPLRSWILHSWSIIVESVNATGGDYEQYITSTSSLMDAHLLAGFKYSKTNKRGMRWCSSAKVAIGRIINGIVATLGPDLATSGKKRLSEFYTIWGLLRQDSGDLRLELEYLKFLEQVVVFAPARFQQSDLMYVLSVLSDAFVFAPVDPASATTAPPAMQFLASPSTQSSSRSSSFAVSSDEWQRRQLRMNGIGRSILQQVGMSCIRTLVERDPSQIQRHNLQCLLFHALHVEYSGLAWRYLPAVHGMWDYLTFRSFAPYKTAQTADEIRNTILALVDVDVRSSGSSTLQVILWALFCRSIAVGESGASMVDAGDSEQLMMSPKGMDGIVGASLADSSSSAGGAADEVWGIESSGSKNSTLLSSDAITTLVEVWRTTKKKVSDLMMFLPPLSRQVRHFAIECVLRVFALVSSGTSAQRNGTSLHFDLVAARQHVLQRLTVEQQQQQQQQQHSDMKQDPASDNNFLCMYLDEFVTLACHAATASADGSELQMFQSVGLRLLRVLVHKFAAARDPEVHMGDAFLLDPYQAQMTSAIRQALKQSQAPSGSGDNAVAVDLYAPLLIEAFGICGGAITSRLVQDKVALGRILKMVIVNDYGHGQFIGDELTRTRLSLANLSCLAQMVESSVTLAVTQENTGRRGVGGVASSPLVKALVTALSSTSNFVIECWEDVTLSYGVLMRGADQWPRIDSEKESAFLPGNGVTNTSKLHTLLPIPTSGGTAVAPQFSASSLEMYRDVYKRYWPSILSALVTVHTHLSGSLAVGKTGTSLAQLTPLLVAFSVFHIRNGVRDRRQDDEFIPVFHAMPALLKSLLSRDAKQSADGVGDSNFAQLYQSVVSALTNATLRASSTSIRVEAMKALFVCLQRDMISHCADVSDHATLYALVGQAALSPSEAFRQICVDQSKLAHTNDAQLLEVVRCATAGIVMLHTTEQARANVVDALAIVEQGYRCVTDRVGVHDAVLSLSRATIEAVIAFAKTSSVVVAQTESIRAEFRNSHRFLVRWIHEELVVARERNLVQGLDFVLRLAVNYAVAYPEFLARDAMEFHTGAAKVAVEILELLDQDGDQRNALVCAHLFEGLCGVAKKLIDVQDVANTQRWFAALGPLLVQLLDRYSVQGALRSPDDVNELAHAEALLRLLTTQLDDGFGAAFVRLLLPKIAAILQAQATSEHSAIVSANVARLLLSFAQTRAVAFKEVVVAMDPTVRSVLELALRQALTQGNTAAASATNGVAAGRSLDLSRYG